MASLRLRTIAGDGDRILVLGVTIPSSMAMDPDDMATLLSLGLYPLASPGRQALGFASPILSPLLGLRRG